MIHNPTVDMLLQRRSIRAFEQNPIDEDTIATLERCAQQAPSSQYLNDWSAIRVTDPEKRQKLAEIGHQKYIGTAPLLYIYVVDEHRNAQIAQRKGIDPESDEFTLKASYRFSQAQNDAVLGMSAMMTAAESLGLGSVVLGTILNDIPQVIELLDLPKYTYPVLGLALGKPAQHPEIKPRMPRYVQFMENSYFNEADVTEERMAAFDEEVHTYYDLRKGGRPEETFSKQIAQKAVDTEVLDRGIKHAEAQGFQLDR
ncbi:nitroreductase family protein [Bifidobacterium dolichotidis]|uniref:nitroreductase family protein n=1 Tax=Bifidobacterium dolichotidis TaxID=2306976 RepID=UPI000F7D79AD|nr:nitroreductase family protein [Bifidobacterium dolichotidis]